MSIRKEKAVLILSALLLGWFVWKDTRPSGTRVSRRAGDKLPFITHPAPDVSRALRLEREAGRFTRDLFSPPRDTAPLPMLDVVVPLLEELESLAPPTSWGPTARYMGQALRRPARGTRVPGLFARAETSVAEQGFGLPDENLDIPRSSTPATPEREDLTPEETAERIEGYKRSYDWIYTSRPVFGFIRNEDRYRLSENTAAIRFEEVVPETGEARYRNTEPITYERDRVREFGFADTTANALELKRVLSFGDGVSSSDLDDALEFVDRCIETRLEAPRALEIAEEVVEMAREVSDGDPRAPLLLARCYEAGFRFEDALDIYERLLASGYDKNALVHARLGDLLARFRLFEDAERAFDEALRWGGSSWEVRWRYGRYLMQRGDAAGAIAQLARATSSELPSADTRRERTTMRTDHGWSLLMEARFEEASSWFSRALNLTSSDEGALAGRLSAAVYMKDGVDAEQQEEADLANASFELLLARGLEAIQQERWSDAIAALNTAAVADPFRSHQALRALSWVAEQTGYPEEAVAFIEEAWEIDPTDPYTLFQRGRLALAADDLEGAYASFRDALDQELDFCDALAYVGEVERRRGRYEAAERYYERALRLDPERELVHTLRGFNLLALNDVVGAQESFQAARGGYVGSPQARIGTVWCTYLSGDSLEAMTLLADLEESRRAESDNDPFKLYAQTQMERLQDHMEKEVWTDRFDRRTTRIGKGWTAQQELGLDVILRDGAVEISGQAEKAGRTRLIQELPAGRYVSHQMEVTVHGGTTADVGLFVSRERRVRGEDQVQAEVALARMEDHNVGYRVVTKGERGVPYKDLFTTEWPTDQPMRLKIERRGNGADTQIWLFFDGMPVLEGISFSALGSTTASLRYGLFVETDLGRRAEVTVDNVEIVRRIAQ